MKMSLDDARYQLKLYKEVLKRNEISHNNLLKSISKYEKYIRSLQK